MVSINRLIIMTDRISFFITLVEMGFRTFYSSGTSSVHDFLSET